MRRFLSFLGVVLIGMVVVAWAGPASAQNTNFTTSTAEIDTVVDTPVTQQVNDFSTELIARMQGGPVLFDQTFSVPVADPAILAAVGTAKTILTGDGASSFLGPNLLSSADTLSSATHTVVTNQTTTVLTGTGQWVGPATPDVNALGICQSYVLVSGSQGVTHGLTHGDNYPLVSGCSGGTPFDLLAGQVDFDTVVLSLVDISTTTTTTNTDLLTQIYELDGVPAVVAAPEPPVLLLFGTGLGVILRSRRFKER